MNRIANCIVQILIGSVPIVASAGIFDDAVAGEAIETVSIDPNSNSSINGDAADVSPLKFNLNGYMRGDLFVGKMPENPRAETKTGYGELSLKLRAVRGKRGDAVGEIRFKGGYLNESHYLGEPSDLPSAKEDRKEFGTSATLREAYVNLYVNRFSLKLGKQIVEWGLADGINPTNNITPVDMRVRSPEESDRRQGNFGARARFEFLPLKLEAVWMPVYSPSTMPPIEISDAVTFAAPRYPDFDIQNSLTAGKVGWFFSGFEMSLSYLFGYSLTPGLTLVSQQLNAAPVNVTVARRAFKHHVAGFDFSTSIGEVLGVRGEVAFRYPVKQPSIQKKTIHVPNPDLYYVLGADKEIGNVMFIGQYIGRTVFNWESVPDGDEAIEAFIDQSNLNLDMNNLDSIIEEYPFIPADTKSYLANRELALKNRLIQGQSQQVQHGASLRVSWTTLHDTLSLVALAFANFTTREWALFPKVVYKVVDDLTVSAGAEIYIGPNNSLFGMIDQTMSAGYAEMKVSF